jgi:hypothetical protein
MISELEAPEGLYRLNPAARPEMLLLGDRLPVLIVDDLFVDAHAVRESALQLQFRAPPYPYPGRLGEPDNQEPSLKAFLASVLDLVNREYLPRIPTIRENGQPITRFRRIQADFAVTDVHPDELAPVQRAPHIDPVPIFGLVYLNQTDRGGTLFFEHSGAPAAAARAGYFSVGDAVFSLVGKIEGRFNRLAIYPGFVPHTGEITGDWITTDERFKDPRLTQRLVFFP